MWPTVVQLPPWLHFSWGQHCDSRTNVKHSFQKKYGIAYDAQFPIGFPHSQICHILFTICSPPLRKMISNNINNNAMNAIICNLGGHFFNKKMNLEQSMQERWWAGTWYEVRNGIDSKQATVATAIKNELMSEYTKFSVLFVFMS